ncbi:Hypothetical predicted protein, partial [Paramuricea clavata]
MSSNAESNSQQSNEKGILKKLSHIITSSIENFFYRLGKTVGGSPWITILVSLMVCAVCMVGFLRFEQESRGEKLWVPSDAKAQSDKEWVEDMFPEESAQVNFIIEESNVLTADIMKQIFKIHQEVVNVTVSFENKNLGWKDMCFRKGDICSLASILELWSFDANTINALTNDKVLADINNRGPRSPYSKSKFTIARVLADISYTENGSISEAQLLKASYFYEQLPSLVDPSDNPDDAEKTINSDLNMEANTDRVIEVKDLEVICHDHVNNERANESASTIQVNDQCGFHDKDQLTNLNANNSRFIETSTKENPSLLNVHKFQFLMTISRVTIDLTTKPKKGINIIYNPQPDNAPRVNTANKPIVSQHWSGYNQSVQWHPQWTGIFSISPETANGNPFMPSLQLPSFPLLQGTSLLPSYSRGGGVCAFISTNIPAKRRMDLENPSHECLWLWLRPHRLPRHLTGLICCIDRVRLDTPTREAPLGSSDHNIVKCFWKMVLLTLFPSKVIRIHNSDKPWMTPAFKKLIYQRQKAFHSGVKKRAYYTNKMSGKKRSATNNIKIVKNGTTLSGLLRISPSLSKILEDFVVNWMVDDVKHKINPQQFGCLKGTSTTKAFDRIDHNILLSLKSPSIGVPQGTKLGPILFIIMINDLELASSSTDHWKYVDDVTISESLKKNEVSVLQSDLNTIERWTVNNNMKLNGKKCKEMIVNLVPSFKILGLTMNNKLKWQDNTEAFVKKASKCLYIIRVLQRCGLPPNDLLLVYFSMVRSILEYACPVWHTMLPKCLGDKIEKVQKRAFH